MIDIAQKPRDGCLYEVRQKGQKDPCYVVVPNPKVRYFLNSNLFYSKCKFIKVVCLNKPVKLLQAANRY